MRLQWSSFLGILGIILLLLTLHLGFGLIVALILASLCRLVYLKLPLAWPGWLRKAITYLSLGLLVLGLAVLLSSGVRYGVKTVQTQKDNVSEYVLRAMNDIRPHIPQPLRKQLPDTPEDVQTMMESAVGVFGKHALEVGGTGMHLLMQFLFATLIAASVCVRDGNSKYSPPPFREAWMARIHEYRRCFGALMGAQVYVAIWNALCTAIFVYAVLPLMGVDLVFREALVVFTLIISLIPAVGNMVANAVMAFLCLPHGVGIMFLALAFLIVVHKVEYLINARIIGRQVEATVPEMLLAIIIGERLFGLPGLVLGPVSYAYIKQFLMQQKLV